MTIRSLNLLILFLLALHGSTAQTTLPQVKCCKDKKEPEKPQIIKLAMKCDVAGVTDLIANGTPVETKDEEGNTLLKYAVEAQCEKLIDFLITAGADINAPSVYHRTPFSSATSTGPATLVKRLIALGADVNAKDKFGWTILFDPKDFAVMKALVEAGSDLNAQDKNGFTALIHAAMGCREEQIAYLVGKGADVNARNELGLTALHMASCPYPGVLESLLSGGADINARDNHGRTPLMTTMGYPDTTELFIKAGADVNLTDKRGRTALDYALKIDTFRKEIVALLKNAGAVSGNSQTNRRSTRARKP
jgi:ankyrin repeat protein